MNKVFVILDDLLAQKKPNKKRANSLLALHLVLLSFN